MLSISIDILPPKLLIIALAVESPRPRFPVNSLVVKNGVKKGDRVAFHLPNCPQYIIALYGTFYAGGTSIGINFLLKSNEIAYQLADSGAIAIITLDSFYEESVREALSSNETDIKFVITTNIADVLNIVPEAKENLIKMGRIPYGEVVPVEGIKYFTYKEVVVKRILD